MKPALEYRDAVKRYRGRAALDGLTLTVPHGCVMGLIGSNGAGKTTALTAATGLVRLQAGSIHVFDEGPFNSARHAGRVSLLPQDALMPGHLTAQQFLRYLGRLQGVPGERIDREVDRMLEWVHLADRKHARIQTLSHGMRRRLTIAQAFLGTPDLVLLDEPLNGLDPREVTNIRGLMRAKRAGQTLLVSSHLLNEVEAGCDEVAFIEDGRCIRQDRLDAVTARHQVVRVLLGTDRADPGRLEQLLAGDACVFDPASRQLTVTARTKGDDVAALNARLLRVLLDEGLPVLSVHRGVGLEEEYLRGKSPVH